MRTTSIVAGLMLAMPLLTQATQVTLNISGQITSKTNYFDMYGGASLPGATPQDVAAADAVLAPLQAGQAIQLSYTFDTDAMAWHQEYIFSGNVPPGSEPVPLPAGGRFGSDTPGQGNITTHITVGEAGIDHSLTAASNTGSRFVRVRPLVDDVAQGSYLDFHVVDDEARFGSSVVDHRSYDSFVSYSYVDGSDWTRKDVVALLSKFPYTSEGGSGRFYAFDPSCAYGHGECGYAEFDIVSTAVQVTSVPEASSLATMAMGLLGVAALARSRRRTAQPRPQQAQQA